MDAPEYPRDRARISLGDLERWQDHGASWRALELTDAGVLVELCTCYGEPVDTVWGEAPELIEYVRQHAAD